MKQLLIRADDVGYSYGVDAPIDPTLREWLEGQPDLRLVDYRDLQNAALIAKGSSRCRVPYGHSFLEGPL